MTIIDPIDDVLSGQYSDAMRKDLRRQLEDLGVNLLLGTSLTAEPTYAARSDLGIHRRHYIAGTRSARTSGSAATASCRTRTI